MHSLALALTLMFLLPLVFIALTAVMSDQQALTSQLWPREWHWENFAHVFTRSPMLSYFGNSLLYSGLATVGMLLSSVPAAYALARLRWRGRNLAFFAVVAAMLLPPQVVAVPLYLLWAQLGLTGTLWPLVVPYLLGDFFSIFLLRQFFLTIPEDYADAARVDGCSELQVLWRVILPMARPGIAAAALFCFLYTWNDYFGPLLYAGERPESWTLSVALASFRGLHHVEWNLTMAATVLVMLPAVVLFLFAQKSFVKGITFTGVKG
nr:carbohydrate ABC transporter permease [Streptoalloteichus tenebrarius]